MQNKGWTTLKIFMGKLVALRDKGIRARHELQVELELAMAIQKLAVERPSDLYFAVLELANQE